ncbi:hypothetical protein BTO11_06605 [Psychrosphaera saromensis]|uniref:Uncharacterized protein n=1 Tax=Psychrosphaera saromensis TaxID=716813 RepID=A0A2S7UV32_9GAMM|nr:hypothetical protein BTO11_06605 [Psychrosphaera saromensis]
MLLLLLLLLLLVSITKSLHQILFFIKFEAWMLRKDCMSGTTFQSVFVNKNNYLMKYWILLGSGALFYYKSRLPFWAVAKRYSSHQGRWDVINTGMFS